MKKLSILIATTAILAASNSFAKSGSVNFVGEITQETCVATVTPGGGSAVASDVTLPKVGLGSLNTVGNTVGSTEFFITIKSADEAECDLAATVSGIYFEAGSENVNSEGRLNNTSVASEGEGAKNVNIQLLTDKKTVIDLTKGSASQEKSGLNETTGVLQYYAQYYAAGSVKAGDVTSNVDYTISYK